MAKQKNDMWENMINVYVKLDYNHVLYNFFIICNDKSKKKSINN